MGILHDTARGSGAFNSRSSSSSDSFNSRSETDSENDAGFSFSVTRKATVGKESAFSVGSLRSSDGGSSEVEEVKKEDLCSICYDTDVKCDIVLDCGHPFHLDCAKSMLNSRWTGVRITFSFLDCPMCRMPISHPKLNDSVKVFREMESKIRSIALFRAKEDGFVDEVEVKDDEDLAAKAMQLAAFYECFECKEPFFGGLVSCSAEMDLKAEKMKCPKCSFASTSEDYKDFRCFTHGFKYAVFKCDSCCSIATWDCSSNHFCERCHEDACSDKDYPCPGPKDCPLGFPHPPNVPANHGVGDQCPPFVIGCTKCVTDVHDDDDEEDGEIDPESWKDFLF